jgi:crossover junction endodeoxyribonuclease RuvC
MTILGIDPGLATVGYGVIGSGLHSNNMDKYKLLSAGVISTDKTLSLGDRLSIIFNDINELIVKYQPDIVAIEELFFAKNSKTAMTVGQARGVIILACAQNNINIKHYTPLQVKLGLTNDGRASKKQMQQMVKIILSLPEIPRPDDAADGLALALIASRARVYNNI